MQNELEAKFLSVDKEVIRGKLKDLGYSLEIPEYTMRRKTFDFSKVDPGKNKWGRVRQEADKTTMTIKEVTGDGVNDTFEVELVVNDFDTAANFFEACNIHAKAFQENMREVWKKDNIEVTIDTWPGLQPFIEIEGPTEDSLKATSSELGFDYSSAAFGSIDMIYEKELGIPAETIIKLPEITFNTIPTK